MKVADLDTIADYLGISQRDFWEDWTDADGTHHRAVLAERHKDFFERFITLHAAAKRAGIPPSTLYAWRKIGKLQAGNGLVGQRFIDAENCDLLKRKSAQQLAALTVQ